MHNNIHATTGSSCPWRRLSILLVTIFLIVGFIVGPTQGLTARAQGDRGSAILRSSRCQPGGSAGRRRDRARLGTGLPEPGDR